MGLWLSNEVLLQPRSAEQPACRVSLGDRQPRSIMVCQLGSNSRDSASSNSSNNSSSNSSSNSYLVVGTSSGELLWWQLAVQTDAFGAAVGVQLRECGWARAGLAPVTLHLLAQAAPTGVTVIGDPAPAAASSGGGSRGMCGQTLLIAHCAPAANRFHLQAPLQRAVAAGQAHGQKGNLWWRRGRF